MSGFKRPVPGDYAEYFEIYLKTLAADGRDILEILEDQGERVIHGLGQLSEEKANYCYAPGKWSVKEVAGHLIDMERLFAFRALWIARCEVNVQPGVDENIWAANSNAPTRPLAEVLEEYKIMRLSHRQLFQGLDADALQQRGLVDGFSTTVNAFPWLMAAHEGHHLAVLVERYGVDI